VSRFGLRASLVEVELWNRSLQIRYGSLRDRPDYGDPWLLGCACNSKHIVEIGAKVGPVARLMHTSPLVRSVALADPNVETLAVATDNLIRYRMSDRRCLFPL